MTEIIVKTNYITEIDNALGEFYKAAHDEYGSDSYASGWLGSALIAAARKLSEEDQKALLEVLQKDTEANRVKTFQRAEVKRIKLGRKVA
jgi:hypothetical protein